jgi:hypothetical protein
MYVSFSNSVLCLAVMCTFVIYKRLSWVGNQQRDLGKPSYKKKAKQSYRWEAARHPIPCGE